MKLHFMKEEYLHSLKLNLKNNFEHYNDKSNEWIYEFFHKENPFVEIDLQVEEFTLSNKLNDDDDVSKQDIENAITLYTAMKNISDVQASDERLWAGLTHCDFWNYMHYRWLNVKSNIKKDGDISSTIGSRYFFNLTPRRSLITNTLSRLWWLGRLTYDENREDKFELIRYFEKDFSSKILIIFSSNFTGNLEITKGLISALMKLEKENYKVYDGNKRSVFTKAGNFLNVYGGNHILDFYTAEEIEDKVLNHMYKIGENQNIDQ